MVQYGMVSTVIFAVVSTHQPALGPRGGLWPILLMCPIHKEDLGPSSGDINRLMMMMMMIMIKIMMMIMMMMAGYGSKGLF
jgi:hypothetical protein